MYVLNEGEWFFYLVVYVDDVLISFIIKTNVAEMEYNLSVKFEIIELTKVERFLCASIEEEVISINKHNSSMI